MSDNIEIHDDLRVDYCKAGMLPGYSSESLLIRGEYEGIVVNISDWQALKDAGDKLIADNEDR